MSTSPRRPSRRAAPIQSTRLRPNASGTATPAEREGSATTTITSTPAQPLPDSLVLRLRGAHSPSPSTASEDTTEQSTGQRRRIQWAEDVVDNEGLGRKKSKVCCIWHKNREVGESSSEEDSSDSDSDLSDSGDDGGARMAGSRRGRRREKKEHKHEHGEDCGHAHGDEKRKPSPNAYERMPKYEVKPLAKQPGK